MHTYIYDYMQTCIHLYTHFHTQTHTKIERHRQTRHTQKRFLHIHLFVLACGCNSCVYMLTPCYISVPYLNNTFCFYYFYTFFYLFTQLQAIWTWNSFPFVYFHISVYMRVLYPSAMTNRRKSTKCEMIQRRNMENMK